MRYNTTLLSKLSTHNTCQNYQFILHIFAHNNNNSNNYLQGSTNNTYNMKRKEINKPNNVNGKGLIKQIEYLRLLHNVSKSELVKSICSVTIYNKYLNGESDISLNKLEKLASYFNCVVTISY